MIVLSIDEWMNYHTPKGLFLFMIIFSFISLMIWGCCYFSLYLDWSCWLDGLILWHFVCRLKWWEEGGIMEEGNYGGSLIDPSDPKEESNLVLEMFTPLYKEHCNVQEKFWWVVRGSWDPKSLGWGFHSTLFPCHVKKWL